MNYPESTADDLEPPSKDQPNLISVPENEDSTIWRYTSLAKLLNVVRPRSKPSSRTPGKLVFVRSDILEDEYEGTLSEEVRTSLEKVYENIDSTSGIDDRQKFAMCVVSGMAGTHMTPYSILPVILSCASQYYIGTDEFTSTDDSTEDATIDEELFERIGVDENTLNEIDIKDIVEQRKIRESTYLNCWRIGNYESNNMWRAYTVKSGGVAIKSTFKNLCSSFRDWPGILYAGDVNYIDYSTGMTPTDPIGPFFYKRRQFEDESEVRAVCTNYSKARSRFELEDVPDESMQSTRNITVDLSELIDKIVVHPEAGDYMTTVVKETLGHYDVSCNVSHSSLRSD
jgi:hypothetical protein